MRPDWTTCPSNNLKYLLDAVQRLTRFSFGVKFVTCPIKQAGTFLDFPELHLYLARYITMGQTGFLTAWRPVCMVNCFARSWVFTWLQRESPDAAPGWQQLSETHTWTSRKPNWEVGKTCQKQGNLYHLPSNLECIVRSRSFHDPFISKTWFFPPFCALCSRAANTNLQLVGKECV